MIRPTPKAFADLLRDAVHEGTLRARLQDGDLKHGLCEINGDGRMLHLDSSWLWPVEAVSCLAR